MKIVLLKDVTGLGKAGDIKDVSDGYAKNLLIPKKLAVVATVKILSQVETNKKEVERKKQEEIDNTQKLGEKLNGFEVKVPLKAGEDGKPFGSVTVIKIIAGLKKAGFDIEKNQVDLEENIKTLGAHDVKLNLGHGIHATIKVIAETEK